MKVQDRLDAKKEVALGKRTSTRTSGGAAAKESGFAQALRVTRSEATRGELSDLVDQLDEQGRLLKDSRTLAALKRYRELVQKFLKTAVDEAYGLSEERGFDRKGRRRVFILVRLVNAAVEELTRSVLDQHADPLALLEKLGEIRGLLIDLYT